MARGQKGLKGGQRQRFDTAAINATERFCSTQSVKNRGFGRLDGGSKEGREQLIWKLTTAPESPLTRTPTQRRVGAEGDRIVARSMTQRRTSPGQTTDAAKR